MVLRVFPADLYAGTVRVVRESIYLDTSGGRNVPGGVRDGDQTRGIATPAQEQRSGNDDERGGEADPQAVDAPLEDEAQRNAEGKADEPVGQEL